MLFGKKTKKTVCVNGSNLKKRLLLHKTPFYQDCLKMKKNFYCILLLFLTFSLFTGSSGCANKRSKCPSYADSDPKKIFGEKTVQETLDEQEKYGKAYETIPGLGKKKKRRKKNARLF
jgi:hypothetical protein